MDIVLDFDGTITTKDTIGCLGAFAVCRQRQEQQQEQQSGQATWDWIVSSYVADHRRHTDAFVPVEADRRTVAAERAFLASLRAVDGASVARVGRSRLFAGCTDAHLFEAGRDAVRTGKTTLRPGFGRFVVAAACGATVSVLSVNWSAAFIRGVVSLCGADDEEVGDRAMVAAAISDIDIISNDITVDGCISGPSGWCRTENDDDEEARATTDACPPALTTSADKLKAFLERRGSSSGTPTTVYFGDSITDLECLLAASAGVVMADQGGPHGNSALLSCLSRLGFAVPHVSEEEAAGRRPRPRLVWARDFCEVMDSGHLDRLREETASGAKAAAAAAAAAVSLER